MPDFPLSFPFQAGPIEAFVSSEVNTAEASRFDTGAQIDACLEAAHAADFEEYIEAALKCGADFKNFL